MRFIGVEVEQETSAPPPKKNPGSAPGYRYYCAIVLYHLCFSHLYGIKVCEKFPIFY